MYFLDGFVYGKTNKSSIEIKDIKILNDRIMILTFISGEKRLFDGSVLKGKAFEALNSDEIFKTAILDHGVVTWMDGQIDCAPEYMYDNSFENPA